MLETRIEILRHFEVTLHDGEGAGGECLQIGILDIFRCFLKGLFVGFMRFDHAAYVGLVEVRPGQLGKPVHFALFFGRQFRGQRGSFAGGDLR